MIKHSLSIFWVWQTDVWAAHSLIVPLLTYFGLGMPCRIVGLDQHSIKQCVLPNGTKPSSDSMLTNWQCISSSVIYHASLKVKLLLSIFTRAALSAEINAVAWIRAEGWDCETVRTVKWSWYIRTCRGWRPWNNRDHEAVQVIMKVKVNHTSKQ